MENPSKIAQPLMALHLILSFLITAFCGFFGFLASQNLMGGVIGFFAGGLTARFLFRTIVPTECPNCGAFSAFQKGSQPIRYECDECRHVHFTRVSEGNDNFYP